MTSVLYKVEMRCSRPRQSICLVENDKFNIKKFHHYPLVTIATSLTSRTSQFFLIKNAPKCSKIDAKSKENPSLLRLLWTSSFKGILSGGATSEPMEIQQNDHIGPDFGSCIMDVPYNISATPQPILDFDGVLEPLDP